MNSLPPVQCRAWCVDRDGHADAVHPEDQWCGGATYKVQRSLHPRLPVSDDVAKPPIHGDVPDEIEAYLMQRPDEAPYIEVDHVGTPHGNYTLEEAEQYAITLLALVREARGNG